MCGKPSSVTSLLQGGPVCVLLVAVEASVALRRTVKRGCVRRYASCPNQRRANTPHCAVPLKVCWISLWCLETLQRTTQTQSRRHESLSLFLRSLPLRASRRPFFSAVGQTVHCCRGSGGEVDAVAGKMKDHRLKCLSKYSFVFSSNSFFFILFSSKLVLFECFAHYCVPYNGHYFQQVVAARHTFPVDATWAQFW